jgi:hypothetical protein
LVPNSVTTCGTTPASVVVVVVEVVVCPDGSVVIVVSNVVVVVAVVVVVMVTGTHAPPMQRHPANGLERHSIATSPFEDRLMHLSPHLTQSESWAHPVFKVVVVEVVVVVVVVEGP